MKQASFAKFVQMDIAADINAIDDELADKVEERIGELNDVDVAYYVAEYLERAHKAQREMGDGFIPHEDSGKLQNYMFNLLG